MPKFDVVLSRVATQHAVVLDIEAEDERAALAEAVTSPFITLDWQIIDRQPIEVVTVSRSVLGRPRIPAPANQVLPFPKPEVDPRD